MGPRIADKDKMMKRNIRATGGWMVVGLMLTGLSARPVLGQLITPVLGDAQSFGVLAGSTATNVSTSFTIVNGDLGVWSSGGVNSITGFDVDGGNTILVEPGSTDPTDGEGIVNTPGVIYAGGPVPQNAQSSLTTAMTELNLLPGANYAGQVLGDGVGATVPTLTPGVYSFPSTSADLIGNLELDAEGVNGVYWVFQIGTTLTTASASSVTLINPGSNNGNDVGIFWVVGSSATLGTTTSFIGNILADQSITLNTGAEIDCGRALASIGAVTMDDNYISNFCLGLLNFGYDGGLGFDEEGNLVAIPVDDGNGNGGGGGPGSQIPEPSSAILMGLMFLGLAANRKRLLRSAANRES